MSARDQTQQAPWQDLQVEACAQLSALAMQIAGGRYPWQEAEAAKREANRHIKAAMRYDFLIV